MLTINDYLDAILHDFKNYAMSGVQLCDLKDVHFDGGRIPDYSDLHIQQLYLLRYAYAYCFEYKRMYSSLIHRMNNPLSIAVTSIGCGSMIDYWSLAHVVPRNSQIQYTGVDIIDWSYKITPRFSDEVHFYHNDIITYLSNQFLLADDAYIFPKSISEFSFDKIDEMCTMFGEKVPMNKTVYFLFSLRTDDRSMDRDIARTSHLFSSMLNRGFSSDSNPNSYTILNSSMQGQKIRDVDSDFSHPWEVVNFLSGELHTLCAGYNGQHCYPDCFDRLTRWPILNCQQVRWQLLEFRKEW